MDVMVFTYDTFQWFSIATEHGTHLMAIDNDLHLIFDIVIFAMWNVQRVFDILMICQIIGGASHPSRG